MALIKKKTFKWWFGDLNECSFKLFKVLYNTFQGYMRCWSSGSGHQDSDIKSSGMKIVRRGKSSTVFLGK
jgi:hypothetical protein